MRFDFADLLIEVIGRRASDLHVTAGAPPMVRVRGRLAPLEEFPELTPAETREIVYSILTNDQRQRLETDWQLDFAYQIPNRARFRVNAYFQRSALGAAFRLIPEEIVGIDSLGLPATAHEFTRKPRGLVLVTGPTGSGKSTSLAAMIDEINQAREEPALTAAETGHLVFATLHTQDAPQTIDRVIDVFPAHQQGQVRVQLSVALQGVMTQQLVPTADGAGRAVACEILVPTPAVRNLIREGKTFQIPSAMQTGMGVGMQTMDAALATLVREGKISQQLAEARSSTPDELRRLLGAPPLAA
ncbi:MAG: type IV pili twitching motility protein PilT [Actinobacteria bacterium]|nr:MAG: type IV pili twitching motility protein PilT [Actinomycetota bacterium]